MKRIFLGMILMVVWLIAFRGDPVTVQAQSAPENACVVLVLDESGSMETNDPNYTRNTGAKLLISLLDEEDLVGIVRFSDGATSLTPTLTMVGNGASKRQLLALLTNHPVNGYTHIQAGLQAAIALLEGQPCGTRRIVLLSDGAPMLGPEGLPDGYEAETLQIAEQAGIPIAAIALTVEGESPFLYQLVQRTTPAGVVIPARSADDLLDAFLAVVGQLKDRTVIGAGTTAAPGGASLPLEPGLAQYVERVTYVVSKPADVSATLTAPGGDELDGGSAGVLFAYTDDPTFAVYTVEQPAPGEWGFTLAGNGAVQARAILRSRLRVVVAAPGAYHPQGEAMRLEVRLLEQDATGQVQTLIGDASFTATIERPNGEQEALDQLYDDGTHGDRRAGDGVFSHDYVNTDLEGDYSLRVTGYKGVIPVRQSSRVTVVPFPRLVVLAPTATEVALRGEPLTLAITTEGGTPPVLDQGTYLVEVLSPSGEMEEIGLGTDGAIWQINYAPTQSGTYTFTFRVRDGYYKGMPYTPTTTQTVAVRLIPALGPTVNNLDMGLVERARLEQGLTVEMGMTSSSPTAEPLELQVVGIAGLTLTEVNPRSVPSGASSLYVTLQGSLEPGVYQGTVLLSTREGVDILRREIPFTLTVIQPTLTVDVTPPLEVTLREDGRGVEDALTLTVTSTSLQSETVTMAWLGADGVWLRGEPTVIAPQGKGTLRLVPDGNRFVPGTYQGQLLLTGRDGVLLTPADIAVTLTVVPIPFCERWCLPIGAGIAAVGAGVFALLGLLARRPRPYGTLTVTKSPAGIAAPKSVAIRSGFGRSRAVLGSARGADIHLPDPALQPHHAAIVAETRTVREGLGKTAVEVPKLVNVVANVGNGNGVVKVDNAIVPPGGMSEPLKRGSRVAVGGWELVYGE